MLIKGVHCPPLVDLWLKPFAGKVSARFKNLKMGQRHTGKAIESLPLDDYFNIPPGQCLQMRIISPTDERKKNFFQTISVVGNRYDCDQRTVDVSLTGSCRGLDTVQWQIGTSVQEICNSGTIAEHFPFGHKERLVKGQVWYNGPTKSLVIGVGETLKVAGKVLKDVLILQDDRFDKTTTFYAPGKGIVKKTIHVDSVLQIDMVATKIWNDKACLFF